MRRQISSKSNTCTESTAVDAAGISVKVVRSTRGGLPVCHGATVVERRRDELVEVSRGHITSIDRREGPNAKKRKGDSIFDDESSRRQEG